MSKHESKMLSDSDVHAYFVNQHVFLFALHNLRHHPDGLTGLFEPFSHAFRSFDRSRRGLGLGLTLVKAFSEMHGGTVSASSKAHGKGSDFIVRCRAREIHRAARFQP